jgi:hypothetical protein
MDATHPKDFLYVRLALNVGNIREVFTYRRIKDRPNRINVGPKEKQLPHLLHNLCREKYQRNPKKAATIIADLCVACLSSLFR